MNFMKLWKTKRTVRRIDAAYKTLEELKNCFQNQTDAWGVTREDDLRAINKMLQVLRRLRDC